MFYGGLEVLGWKNAFQDLHGVDLEEFKYGGTNITAFRLVDPDGSEIRRAVRDWTFPPDSKSKKVDSVASLYRVSLF